MYFDSYIESSNVIVIHGDNPQTYPVWKIVLSTLLLTEITYISIELN